jgi:hypothetical protein
MNQRRPPQLQIRPSLQFSAKAAIQTASMMFSILRRKVARIDKARSSSIFEHNLIKLLCLSQTAFVDDR